MATATLLPTNFLKSSVVTVDGGTGRLVNDFCNCWKHKGSPTRGRVPSAGDFLLYSSHDPNASGSAVSASRRNPVSPIAVALAHLRAALPRDGPRCDRWCGANWDDPAPSSR